MGGLGFRLLLQECNPRLEFSHQPLRAPDLPHHYEDGRIVYAKLYPIDLLPAFIRHFNEVWLPTKAQDYFSQRYPIALEYLPYLLPPPKAA